MPSDLLGAHLDRWDQGSEDTFCWAAGLLSRFTYKPGWHFELSRRPELGQIMLQIAFSAPDSRITDVYGRYGRLDPCRACGSPHPMREIPISGQFPLDPFAALSRNENLFFDWLHQMVRDVEKHELDEWFRVDGELRFDPHRGSVV